MRENQERLKTLRAEDKGSLLPKKSENTNEASFPLPGRVLYTTAARFGGYGLDLHTHEALRGIHEAGILGRAISYENRQHEVPGRFVRSLRWHPIRLLSFLESQNYYGAKKHYLDWIGARELAGGGYDLFHGWSGECVRSLRAAHRLGIPSVIDIPTWHRHKGQQKSPARNQKELDAENAPFPRNWLNSLRISRQQTLEEYDLATLLLVYSKCAAETFTAVGFSKEKLFYLPLATDIERFTPGTHPPLFRAIFTGALIKRKGVDTLLEAWHRLHLKNAELVLVGSVHDEMKPYLDQFADDSVKVEGFSLRPEDHLRSSSVHIFPSTCEGSAKTTYDAAACGLAQISTRESGDVVVDGLNGLVVPSGDVDALAAAIEHLYRNPNLIESMGAAARKRVVENFTWSHFRKRLVESYRVALGAPALQEIP